MWRCVGQNKQARCRSRVSGLCSLFQTGCCWLSDLIGQSGRASPPEGGWQREDLPVNGHTNDEMNQICTIDQIGSLSLIIPATVWCLEYHRSSFVFEV